MPTKLSRQSFLASLTGIYPVKELVNTGNQGYAIRLFLQVGGDQF